MSFLDESCRGDEALRHELEAIGAFGADLPSTDLGLRSGARLGPYEVVMLLGAGSMGEVYHARDPRLGRDIAIKILPRALAGDRDRQARFEVEARAPGQLHHPNVVAVHDIGLHAGAPFLVMELLEGETLRGRLRRGSLPPTEALDVLSQMVRGLAAAHAKGVVHRDLKPENLFVTRDGVIKILDFGIAKLNSAAPDSATSVQ